MSAEALKYLERHKIDDQFIKQTKYVMNKGALLSEFLQDYAESYHQHTISGLNNEDNFKMLYPKYNCPKCDDWFHMPYKYCKCDSKVNQ